MGSLWSPYGVLVGSFEEQKPSSPFSQAHVDHSVKMDMIQWLFPTEQLNSAGNHLLYFVLARVNPKATLSTPL